MKKIAFTILFSTLMILQLNAQDFPLMSSQKVFPNTANISSAQMDNELEPAKEGENENIYDNPILLNGKLLDYHEFGLQSEGILNLMAGDPMSSEATSIPFTIQLRRDGKILNDPTMEFIDHVFYDMEVSSVMQFAKPGDQLIIKPVNTRYWKAKRILLVINRDGC